MTEAAEVSTRPTPTRWARPLWQLLRGRAPGQLVIQMTDRCNAHCPQCGMRVKNRFPRTRLERDVVKRMIDAAVARGMEAVSFTGGEPLLFLEELTELIRYAGQAGIRYIRTGSNGFFLRDPESPGFTDRVRHVAESLADTPLRNLWISLDSAEPSVHEAMRGLPGVVRGMQRALPLFHDLGLYPSANLGINRNTGGNGDRRLPALDAPGDPDQEQAFVQACDEGFRRFFRFVADLGFTMVNLCYPMSVEPPEEDGSLKPVYAATSVDSVIRFRREEKALLFGTLLSVIPAYRRMIRIFSPLCSLHALHRQYGETAADAYPCRGGVDFFFVNARDGNTYPCGYRGAESLGKLWKLNGNRAVRADCTRCDWECFRDPSELFGPILQGLRDPVGLRGKLREDPAFFRLWLEDLRYYRRCGFFDGRRPPAFTRHVRRVPTPDFARAEFAAAARREP